MAKKYILPTMINVSNNSRLTHSISTMLERKLTELELNEFYDWIKLIRTKQNSVKIHNFLNPKFK